LVASSGHNASTSQVGDTSGCMERGASVWDLVVVVTVRLPLPALQNSVHCASQRGDFFPACTRACCTATEEINQSIHAKSAMEKLNARLCALQTAQPIPACDSSNLAARMCVPRRRPRQATEIFFFTLWASRRLYGCKKVEAHYPSKIGMSTRTNDIHEGIRVPHTSSIALLLATFDDALHRDSHAKCPFASLSSSGHVNQTPVIEHVDPCRT
jgi:hypothetical protein